MNDLKPPIIFIALIFFLALPCAGQEGCGQWIQLWNSGTNGAGLLNMRLWDEDSVWVPGQCHKDTSSGDWYMQYKQAQLSYGTKDGWRSDTITIRIRLDTLWQVAESVWIEEPK